MGKDFDQILEGMEEALRYVSGENTGAITSWWSSEDGCYLARQHGVTAHGDTLTEAWAMLREALALRAANP